MLAGNLTKYIYVDDITIEHLLFDLPLSGDINDDGNIDVSDVNILINIMLGKADTTDYTGNADIDGNGIIDITDVNALINIMLGKS